MSGHRRRDAVLGAGSAVLTAAAWRLLRRPDLPGGGRWARRNHAGEPVTLLEGVALVVGAGLTSALGATTTSPRSLAAATLAVGACGAVGAADDLRPDAARKGLAGHLGALARGEVTTGALKVLVLSGAGLAATVLADTALLGAAASDHAGAARGRLRAGGVRPVQRVVDALLGGAVVAGSANLANLLDLRPGRALKAGLLAGAPLVLTGAGSAPSAVALGAGAVLLPADLRGEAMLGDTGANPWGALLGLALVERAGTRGRAVALVALTGLTLASERVSFTRVIESTPGLRELDALGRPPVIPSPADEGTG